MSFTKKRKKHYRKVERDLRVGSEVRVKGNDGFVLSISEYPKPDYDYKTASVRFYDKDVKTRSYSLGSLELKSSHLDNLYTLLTGKRTSNVDLFDFIDQIKKLEQFKDYERFINAYYNCNYTKKETGLKCRCHKKYVKVIRKNFEKALLKNNLGRSILDSMPIDLSSPICSMLENKYLVRYLNKKGKFLLQDIKDLERPDLFKGVSRGDCVAIQRLHKTLNNL